MIIILKILKTQNSVKYWVLCSCFLLPNEFMYDFVVDFVRIIATKLDGFDKQVSALNSFYQILFRLHVMFLFLCSYGETRHNRQKSKALLSSLFVLALITTTWKDVFDTRIFFCFSSPRFQTLLYSRTYRYYFSFAFTSDHSASVKQSVSSMLSVHCFESDVFHVVSLGLASL